MWVVNATLRELYTREKYLVPLVQEVGWDTGPVWTGAEILASDRPARSESLNQLSYPMTSAKILTNVTNAR